MKAEKIFSEIDHTVLKGDPSEYDISDIVFDSKKAVSGTMFACLKGKTSDGHRYVSDAYSRGCRAFLCSDVPPESELASDEEVLLIKADDTRRTLALASAALYQHPEKKLHLIGITGTKGKTSSALLIRSILGKCGIECAYIGTNGVYIGDRHFESGNTTPESSEIMRYLCETVKAGIKYAVLEVSSQALDNGRLYGIRFERAVFTNFSEDHIGPLEHHSFEEYKCAKRKLFTEHLEKEGKMIVNCDDEASSFMTEGVKGEIITFSMNNPSADYYGYDLKRFRDEYTFGISFEGKVKDGTVMKFTVNNPGIFSVYNALAAISVAASFDVAPEKIADSLADSFIEGRFEIVRGTPGIIFIIDYAHNKVSLTNALLELKNYSPDRIICVFGSIGGRARGRRKELALAADKYADFSVVTSDNPDFDDPEEIVKEIESFFSTPQNHIGIADREKAVRYAVEIAKPGDFVLFAGKGHENFQLIKGEKIPFSERNIILSECRKKA